MAFMRQLTRQGSPAARMVARRFLDLDHGDGAWPGYEAAAEWAGLSPGTVRRAIGELYRLGAAVSARRAALGNKRAYFLVAVEDWPLHVTRDGDTDSVSPETVTPAGATSPSVSPLMSPSVSPPMSPQWPTGVRGGSSSGQEMGIEDGAAAGGRAPGERAPAPADAAHTPPVSDPLAGLTMTARALAPHDHRAARFLDTPAAPTPPNEEPAP